MMWDEDPRVQQAIWRFFSGSVVLITVLAIVGGIAYQDVEFMLNWLGLLVTIGLALAVLGLACGLIMRGLFSLGDLAHWLRTHLLSRTNH